MSPMATKNGRMIGAFHASICRVTEDVVDRQEELVFRPKLATCGKR